MTKKVDDIHKLKTLVEKFIECYEDEMEHGQYHTPDFVPDEFSNERDYYGKHEKIVDKVVKARNRLEKFLAKIK